MPSNINTTPANNPNVPGGDVSTSPYFGNLSQVSAGPAGILYALANQLLDLYNKIQAEYNQMVIAQNSAAKSMIIAGADAQRQAGVDQKWATMGQAIASSGQGVGTVASTMIEQRSNPYNSQLQTEDGNLTTLQKLETLENRPVNINVSSRNPATNIDPAQHAQRLLDDPLSQGTDEENQAGYNHMTAQQQKDFKAQLANKIEGTEKRINTISNRSERIGRQAQMTGNLLSGSIGAGGSSLQAFKSSSAAQSNAAQQVAQALSQQTTSAAETAKQQLSNLGGRTGQVIDAAKQGAQAYAQT